MVWPTPTQRPNNQVFPAGYHPRTRVNHPPYARQGFLPAQQAQGFFTPDRIGSLTQKLDNLQRILKTVQSAVPLIQQYGPIVKNLPTMFQLMKALNESGTDTDDEEESFSDEDWSDELEEEDESLEEFESSSDSGGEKVTNFRKGESVPKLFI